ncbi:MAG: rhodanese-like domain-containing protein [Bryobacteraceae bacterium]
MMAEELASADPPLLLDVRSTHEWAARHIDSSVNVPPNHQRDAMKLRSPMNSRGLSNPINVPNASRQYGSPLRVHSALTDQLC